MSTGMMDLLQTTIDHDVLVTGKVLCAFEARQQPCGPFDKTFHSALIGPVPIDRVRVIA